MFRYEGLPKQGGHSDLRHQYLTFGGQFESISGNYYEFYFAVRSIPPCLFGPFVL